MSKTRPSNAGSYRRKKGTAVSGHTMRVGASFGASKRLFRTNRPRRPCVKRRQSRRKESRGPDQDQGNRASQDDPSKTGGRASNHLRQGDINENHDKRQAVHPRNGGYR